MIEVDKRINRIVTGLNDVAKKLEKEGCIGNKPWTEEIKEKLAKLAKKEGLDVFTCPSMLDEEQAWGEWLYDFCWLQYEVDKERKPLRLRRVLLIVESEWGNFKEVHSDFEKLLVGRADLKLLIFQARDKAKIEERVKEITEFINLYSQTKKGEIYLLMGYDNKEGGFQSFRVEIGTTCLAPISL